MLRITVVEGIDGSEELRLEGRVAGPWVTELKTAAEACLERPGRLALDLADVSFVDLEGAALLRELQGREVAIRGCSSFVAGLLGLRASA